MTALPAEIREAAAEALADHDAYETWCCSDAVLAAVAPAILRWAADRWTQGEWANTPRRADRVADRMAAAQFTGDWLRALAASLTAQTGEPTP